MARLRFMRRGGRMRLRGLDAEDEDPLSGVANLFDVAMVFALGLIVMLLLYMSIPELLTQADVTIVKNPGQPNMEVIVKQGKEVKKLPLQNETVQAEVVAVVGKICKTKDGRLIYVPAEGE